MTNDIYGKGLLAYVNGKKNSYFTVESNIAETEKWPVSTFFRSYNEMPETEKIALSKTTGCILDVGAGAGSHALWLQQQDKNVTAIDISAGAVEVMQMRGVQNAFQQDYFAFSGQQFDTILMLMNGIGITGKLEKLPLFFEKAKQLLHQGGKILLDSSDIIYLFREEDGCIMLDLNAPYYGEVNYRYKFNKESGEYFNWLFVDFNTLHDYAEKCGFSCNKLFEDSHYLYLAELILK